MSMQRRAARIAWIVLVVVVSVTVAVIGLQPDVLRPVTAEVLPQAVRAAPDARLTCGGEITFPRSGLDAPTGEETASGPESDALRAALSKFGSEFPGADFLRWRRAGGDEHVVVYLARTPDGRWLSVRIGAIAGGWTPRGMGECTPRVVLSREYGPAEWALDPAYPSPALVDTRLHLLVWEMACSSGSPTTGRMSAPLIEYNSGSVTVTIGVRPLDGDFQTCQGPPGTPTIVDLAEPLGDRTLLDGGRVPPAAPSPPY